MYGHVNTLEETFKVLGLSKKPVVTESKDDADKKKLIESARAEKKPVVTESKAAPAKPTNGAKSKTMLLAEEIENLDKDLAAAVSAKSLVAPEKTNESKEMTKIASSLNYVMKFCSEAITKLEWRQEERSKKLANVFKMLREESDRVVQGIKKGTISEESAAKGEANSVIKRFVEAVGYVKAAFKVNESVYAALKESLKNAK